MLPEGVTIERAYNVACAMASEVARRRMHRHDVVSAAGLALAEAIRDVRGDGPWHFWACLRGKVRTALADAFRAQRSRGVRYNSVRLARRAEWVTLDRALDKADDCNPLARLVAAETLAMLTPEELALAWALEGSTPVEVARRMGVGRSTVCGWRNRARARVQAAG